MIFLEAMEMNIRLRKIWRENIFGGEKSSPSYTIIPDKHIIYNIETLNIVFFVGAFPKFRKSDH
jgi:hypothetical protein